MKAFKIAPLAVAIGALTFANISNAEVTLSLDVEVDGSIDVEGLVNVDRVGMASIDDVQRSHSQDVTNRAFSNDADMGDGALSNASGNIGVNVAAGDNNVQGNSTALAASDAGFVFGETRRDLDVGSSAKSEIFINQQAYSNVTTSEAQRNSSSMGNDALKGASGNLGVNIAAGNSNVQKNALAGAVGFGALSVASINVRQVTDNNMTENLPLEKDDTITTRVRLTADDLSFTLPNGEYKGYGKGKYKGHGYGDYEGDAKGKWKGKRRGYGRYYGSEEGELDFKEKGKLGFKEKGELDFSEADPVELEGSLTGRVVTRIQVIDQRGWNRATMGDDAMANASGNIGVNIASGTNNLQNNSLAISALRGSDFGTSTTD